MEVDKYKELCFSAEDYEVISNFACLLDNILWECSIFTKEFKLTSERGLVFTEEEIIKLCRKLDILDSECISVKEREEDN